MRLLARLMGARLSQEPVADGADTGSHTSVTLEPHPVTASSPPAA
jgi:hypothetical protein